MRLTGTPISGMPILRAYEAGRVLIINLDDRPGYSGVRNQLYDDPASILVWGDAKSSLRQLLDELAGSTEPAVEVGGFSTA
jgi:NAD(P) transhydrogenase subunit beta